MPVFDKPAIDLSAKRIIAVFTVYNEAERIPFFLAYYRRMGVSHFLAIDNNSSDNTRDLLITQPDVSYFHTTSSYAASNAGRLWTSELAEHYCRDCWCLTLDLDEQLVFPGSEHLMLTDLCNYLDEYSYDGIFTVFLDMYHAGPLSDAVYRPGQPFLEVCDHFEPTTYTLQRPKFFPPIGVFGGPRQRIFWSQGNAGRGPAMRKMPLTRWRNGFAYRSSTHSSTPMRLADMTGALLHFKFFSSFGSFAERELARGDRVKTADYEKYAQLAKEETLTFASPHSVRYRSSISLVEHGVTVCSRAWLYWLRPRLTAAIGPARAKQYEARLRETMKQAEKRAMLQLVHLPALWPLLTTRAEGGILSVSGRDVLGWFSFRAGEPPADAIEARVRGQVIAIGVAQAALHDCAVLDPEPRRLAFRITLPETIFEIAPTVRVAFAPRGDSVPFATAELHMSGAIPDRGEYDGECELTPEGQVAGWVWSPRDPPRRVGVAVHIDGLFWQRTKAELPNPDPAALKAGSDRRHFCLDLPESLDRSQPHDIRVFVEGTNFSLSTAPLVWPARNAVAAGTSVAPVLAPVIAESAYATAARVTEPGCERPRFAGGIEGGVMAVRRGEILGWARDAANPDRALKIELVVGNAVRRCVTADIAIPIATGEPGAARDHGFIMPVFPPWLMMVRHAELRHVQLQVDGRYDTRTAEIPVAGRGAKMAHLGYRGSCEPSDDGLVRGWVWQPGSFEPVNLTLFVDGALGSTVRADLYRADLAARGIGDGRHGFAASIPSRFLDGGEHLVHVVTAREGVPLRDSPLVVTGALLRPRAGLLAGNGPLAWLTPIRPAPGGLAPADQHARS